MELLLNKFGPEKCLINARNKRDESALFVAATLGNTWIIRTLVTHGAEIDEVGSKRRSVLCNLLRNNEVDFETVKFLVENGADLNGRDRKSNTVLMSCCERKENHHLLEKLIELGGDFNLKERNGISLVHILAMKDNVYLLKLIVEKYGVKVDTKGNLGETALFLACKGGMKNTIQYLLSANASLNERAMLEGMTPLMVSCEYGMICSVNLLLESVVDKSSYIMEEDYDKCLTSLEYALQRPNSEELIELLVRNGANLDHYTRGSVPCVFHCKGTENLETMCRFKKIDFNDLLAMQDKRGANILLHACFNGDFEIVKWLIEKCGDENFGLLLKKNCQLQNAIMVACQRPSNSKVLKKLLSNENMRFLLEEKDQKGRTAIFYCLPHRNDSLDYSGQLKNFLVLTSFRVDFSVKDDSDFSPYEIAKQRNLNFFVNKMEGKIYI